MDKLNSDPNNPNRMKKADKERLKRSLSEFGDLGGIILNRRTGLLIGGHQRVSVLDGCEIDVTDLPKPESDGTVARGYVCRGGVRYSVRVVDWTPEKAHAALLAANRFGRVGSNDGELLKGLLAELGDTDLSLTGFDEATLAELLKSTEAGSNGDPIAEDFDVEKMCIIVISKTTEEQRSLFEELTERGIACRLSSM